MSAKDQPSSPDEINPAGHRWLAFTVRVILVLALAGYALSGFRVVGPQENALVLRFGKLQPKLHGPGLLPAFPRPIDEVIKVPVQTVQELNILDWQAREAEISTDPGEVSVEEPPLYDDPLLASEDSTDLVFAEGQTLHPIDDGYSLTGDSNIMQGPLRVRYQISDPVAYALHVAAPEQAVRATVLDAATTTLAGMSVNDILSGTGQVEFRLAALKRAQETLDHLKVGVRLIALETEGLRPPLAVLPAFREVNNAQVEARTARDEAFSYQAATELQAEGTANRIQQRARAEAVSSLNEVIGEAASFLAIREQYEKQPDLFRLRLQLETLEQVYAAAADRAILTPGVNRLRLYVGGNREGAGGAALPGLATDDETLEEPGDGLFPDEGQDESETDASGLPIDDATGAFLPESEE